MEAEHMIDWKKYYEGLIRYATRKAKEKGETKGRAEERVNIAAAQISYGIPIEAIKESLKLTDEEIEKAIKLSMKAA